MASYTRMTEKLILEATIIAKSRKTKLTPEILMEASENIHKSRGPAPDPPEGSITYMEAERLYGINHSTISRWVQNGYIDIILETKREIYVDKIQLENLIAYYKENPGRGRFTLRYLFGKGHPRHDYKLRESDDN